MTFRSRGAAEVPAGVRGLRPPLLLATRFVDVTTVLALSSTALTGRSPAAVRAACFPAAVPSVRWPSRRHGSALNRWRTRRIRRGSSCGEIPIFIDSSRGSSWLRVTMKRRGARKLRSLSPISKSTGPPMTLLVPVIEWCPRHRDGGAPPHVVDAHPHVWRRDSRVSANPCQPAGIPCRKAVSDRGGNSITRPRDRARRIRDDPGLVRGEETDERMGLVAQETRPRRRPIIGPAWGYSARRGGFGARRKATPAARAAADHKLVAAWYPLTAISRCEGAAVPPKTLAARL